MYCPQCGTLKAADAKFCVGCGTQFDEVMNERPEPDQQIAEEIQEAETLENSDASSSEPTPKTPRTPGPKGPPPSRIKDTPPEESMEATSRLDDGTSNGELEEVGFAFASIGKKKIISGMLVSIILLGSIVFFLVGDERYAGDLELEKGCQATYGDEPDLCLPYGTYTSETGETIGIFGSNCEVTSSGCDGDWGGVMYLVTYESDCSESQLNQNWIDQRKDADGSCYWVNRDYPHFQEWNAGFFWGGYSVEEYDVWVMDPVLCFDGNNAIDGAPGGCLRFVEVGDHYIVISDHYLLPSNGADDNTWVEGECEVLLGSSVNPPSDTMDADNWISNNQYHFDYVRDKFPAMCESSTGAGPLNLLFEQIV